MTTEVTKKQIKRLAPLVGAKFTPNSTPPEGKPDINREWKANAQAHAAALNIIYEYVGTHVGPIPNIEHMKRCGANPVEVTRHIIETIEKRLNRPDTS